MAVDFTTAYDLTLTIDGVDYGLVLYVDQQTGMRHLNEGLAPLLTPQQRISEFSYEHIPPEIDVAAAFENWSGGAGFNEHVAVSNPLGITSSTSNTPRSYNYSKGLDLSWTNRVYMSPKRQTDLAATGSAIAAAPTFFWYSSEFGLWCIAGVYMYKYNFPTNSWVLRNTAAAAVTSMVELNGVLYASLTESAYIYTTSTSGIGWTTSTLAGGLTNYIADLFVTRRSSLFAIRGESLYATTNGQNGGVNWSAGTAIGSTSEQTNSMITINDEIWIFKREGIYVYDGTNATQVWVSPYITDQNGKYALSHSDGNVYVVYGSFILGIEAFNTSSTPLRIVFPAQANDSDASVIPHDAEEIKGTISQLTGNLHELMFTVENAHGHVHLMKCDPRTQVFHTYAYLGANSSAACLIAPAGTMHATNPCVAVGYGTGAAHYILPQSDMLPEDDGAYEFDTTEGFVVGPWISYGARAFDKFLNRGTVLARHATAGQPITLSYERDNDDNETTLVTAMDEGSNSSNVSGEVSFNRLRYIIRMNAASVAQSPILVAATLHATLNPPRRKVWKPLIQLAPNLELRDGTRDPQDPATVRAALLAAGTKRVTLTDSHQHTYTVRLLDVQEQGMMRYREGGIERDSQIFQLVLAEITPGTTNQAQGQYGNDAFGGGKVYG